MFKLFWQSMHVTNGYVILFLASVKTGDTGIVLQRKPGIFIYFWCVKLCKVLIFADDTKIFSFISNLPDCKKLQEHLDNLSNLSEKWKFSFNAKKCTVLLIGSNNEQYRYSMQIFNADIQCMTTMGIMFMWKMWTMKKIFEWLLTVI